MKNFTKMILTKVVLAVAVFSVDAQTNVSGGIFANTTWTQANSPYIVVDTIVVFPGFMLTIEPGVVVKFEDHKYIEVRQGTLIAIGTSTDSITFTSNSLNPTPGIWGNNSNGGIWLNGALLATSFNYCIVKYATKGIYNAGCAYIKNSTFINNVSGLSLVGVPHIDSCIFEFNTTGLENVNQSAINFCRISNNTDGIGQMGGGSVVNCLIESNETGLGGQSYVYNVDIHDCIIRNNHTGLVGNNGGNTVRDCIIDSNSISGISMFGHGFTGDIVSNCEIKFNGIGLIASSCPNNGNPSQFTQCIIENNTIGVKVGGCSNVFCNRICNNTSYDLENLLVIPFSVPNNFWCITDSATVAAHIFDAHDDLSLGIITFMPLDRVSCYLLTGIPDYKDHPLSFSIFPNPANNFISIQMPENISKSEIKIFNMLGKLVYYSSLENQEEVIDVSHLSNSVYILEVVSGENVGRQKFVKQ